MYKNKYMLEKSIIKLGLSDKESKVYLASLELGPSTAQIISNKSNVNRATTYVVIESLMKMGLMSTYDEGKKTFFIASPPEQLMKYLKNRENEVTEKINTLNDIMSQLNFLAEIGQNQWKIKSYE